VGRRASAKTPRSFGKPEIFSCQGTNSLPSIRTSSPWTRKKRSGSRFSSSRKKETPA